MREKKFDPSIRNVCTRCKFYKYENRHHLCCVDGKILPMGHDKKDGTLYQGRIFLVPEKCPFELEHVMDQAIDK